MLIFVGQLPPHCSKSGTGNFVDELLPRPAADFGHEGSSTVCCPIRRSAQEHCTILTLHKPCQGSSGNKSQRVTFYCALGPCGRLFESWYISWQIKPVCLVVTRWSAKSCDLQMKTRTSKAKRSQNFKKTQQGKGSIKRRLHRLPSSELTNIRVSGPPFKMLVFSKKDKSKWASGGTENSWVFASFLHLHQN